MLSTTPYPALYHPRRRARAAAGTRTTSWRCATAALPLPLPLILTLTRILTLIPNQVRDGGGECGVENMQTLCVACHQRKTGEEAKARRGVKRRNRKVGVEAGVEGLRKARARS
eukprot:scaffold55048_cov57-Phaeocystis_antarctica.AAC.2